MKKSRMFVLFDHDQKFKIEQDSVRCIEIHDFMEKEFKKKGQIVVIEKSVYDKAIEALKKYVGVADRTQKGPTYYSIAEQALKELGELGE